MTSFKEMQARAFALWLAAQASKGGAGVFEFDGVCYSIEEAERLARTYGIIGPDEPKEPSIPKVVYFNDGVINRILKTVVTRG